MGAKGTGGENPADNQKQNTQDPPKEGEKPNREETQPQQQQPPPPPAPPARTETVYTKVEVILENGTVGPDLLVKGDVSDKPIYVQMLNTEAGRKRVKGVK